MPFWMARAMSALISSEPSGWRMMPSTLAAIAISIREVSGYSSVREFPTHSTTASDFAPSCFAAYQTLFQNGSAWDSVTIAMWWV